MLMNCKFAAKVALDRNDEEYLGTVLMAVSLKADLAKLRVKLNIPNNKGNDKILL